MSKVTLPPPREPAIDTRTNTFSRNWVLYFQQLFDRVGGIAADLISLSDFTGSNQSLTPNGYQVLPGGLIRQWGTATLDANASAEIEFPIPFKSACFSFKCEETGAAEASGITFSHSAPTNQIVTVYGSGKGTSNAIKSFDWEAIGK